MNKPLEESRPEMERKWHQRYISAKAHDIESQPGSILESRERTHGTAVEQVCVHDPSIGDTIKDTESRVVISLMCTTAVFNHKVARRLH